MLSTSLIFFFNFVPQPAVKKWKEIRWKKWTISIAESVEKREQRSPKKLKKVRLPEVIRGARCSSMVRAFAHGAMDRRIDPS